MKPEKITVELTDTSDEDVKVKVEFDPPLSGNMDEVELSPSIVALNMMLAALIPDGFENKESFVVH